MATKKTVQAEETMEETIQAAEAQPVEDAWATEVEVVVPRKQKGDDPQYYVCVNDRRFAFPANGKKQKMPLPVAEILQSSLDAEYEAEEFAEEMTRHAEESAKGL